MTHLYFFLGLVCSCSVSGQSPTYGLMGLKVTLKPDVTGTKQPDEILWKHNGNKVVEFDGRKQQEFSLFENRVTLDWISAELSITGLTLDDSGEYDLEVYADKVLKRQTLNLEVLEKLSKPNITCERSKGSSSTDERKATLTCSVESRQPQYLMYEWIYHGTGQRLTVPLRDENKEYTCMVRNRLSNATATVTAKTCYPDEGVSALIIGLIVAGVLLGAVIAVVVGIICCRRYNKGLNNETPHNDEESHLVHRTPTVPSSQRLGGSVRQQVKEFEKNPHIRNLFSGTATAPPRKSSCEGANSSNKGEADAERLDPSHSDQKAEPGLNNEAPQNKHINPLSEPAAPSAQQPVSLSHDDTNMTSTCDEPDNKNDHTDKVDGQSQMASEGNVQEVVSNFENIPNNRTDTKQSFCAETKQLDPLHPEQGTEAGLNNEALQNKQSNPPSEPAAPSAQQPVSLSHDDTNMTSTCDEPDNKNDQTDKVDGQSQMPPEDQQEQLHKDGGEQPPAKETIRPPVPRPRLSKRVPALGTKDTTEHNEGADSDQVTDKTEAENVKLSESEKNNDPNKKSQIAHSDQTKSDNNQSQSPPNPKKPDQSNSLQESPDATHSDLDQQTQDKVECDSPKCEEQSDKNTTVSKEDNDKEEGDTYDNEGQCSGKEKQPDKESDDEDTRLEESDEDGDDDEDTEETMLVEQSAKESESKDTVEIGLQQSDEESDDEDTRLEESDEDGNDEDTEQKKLLK